MFGLLLLILLLIRLFRWLFIVSSSLLCCLWLIVRLCILFGLCVMLNSLMLLCVNSVLSVVGWLNLSGEK